MNEGWEYMSGISLSGAPFKLLPFSDSLPNFLFGQQLINVFLTIYPLKRAGDLKIGAPTISPVGNTEGRSCLRPHS